MRSLSFPIPIQRGSKLTQLKKCLRDEEGQDLVEYELLLVFLALGGHRGSSNAQKQHKQGLQPIQ